ncbi:MAG: glycosyltransferase [Desulfovibrio sp.]|jgi:glycosyltransferase involved in cell wall biosynthesis|nr:glycosyltransferase [Desulfovibrio sp.]
MPIPVSVIIPVHNVEAYLCRCLDSVCNQTLKDIEILCINDCSTDHGLDILKKYQAIDARIVLVDFERNMGVSVARNHGIDIAKGEYVGFVDSDDMIDPDFYEKLYGKAIETNANITKGMMAHFDDGKNEPKGFGLSANDISIAPTNFIGEFWSAIYRKEFLTVHGIRFPVGVKTGQDLAFLYKAIALVGRVATVDNVYYRYYERKDSSSSGTFDRQKYISILSAMHDVAKFLNSNSISSSTYDKLYYHILLHCLSMLGRTSDRYESSVHCAGVLLKMYSNCKRLAQLDRILLSNFPELYACLHSRDLDKFVRALHASYELQKKEEV